MRMNGARLTGLACLALAVVLYIAGLVPDMQRAYVFPNVIALSMIALAVFIVLGEWRSLATGPDKLVSKIPWGTIWPGLVVIGVYLLLLRRLGFYTSSLLTFGVIVALYSPQKGLLRRVLIPAGIGLVFMIVMYVVFALVLRVLAPTGILI